MEENKVIRRDQVVSLLRRKKFDKLRKELTKKEIVDHYDGQRYYTPLCAAVLYGNLEMMELILGKGEDPNEKCYGGNPLWVAAHTSKFEFIPRLVESGASYEASTIKGATPMKACIMGVRDFTRSNISSERICETTRVLIDSCLPQSFHKEPLLNIVDDDDQLIMLIEAGANLSGENTYRVPFYPDLASEYPLPMQIRIHNAVVLRSSLMYKLMESMRFIVGADFSATKRVKRRCGSGPSRAKLTRLN